MCMADSLSCSPETITTLLTGYTPVQNKVKEEKKTHWSSTLFLTYYTAVESNILR